MAIVLASQSPRRQELLKGMGLAPFVVRPAQGEETAQPGLSPQALVEALSAQKAAEVAGCSAPQDLIVAADTVVAVGDQVLGKPRSRHQAQQMLQTLSGRSHMVYTGVTVRQGDRILTGHQGTQVIFRTLTQGEIESYVATGEPMDKAGAYGIQGLGALLVEEIQGDYFNVVGLPVGLLHRMLIPFGVDALALAAERGPGT